MCMIFLFENYELRIWICRRTTGPIRRAKGGWTPEEVSAFLDLFNSYARRCCCLLAYWRLGFGVWSKSVVESLLNLDQHDALLVFSVIFILLLMIA